MPYKSAKVKQKYTSKAPKLMDQVQWHAASKRNGQRRNQTLPGVAWGWQYVFPSKSRTKDPRSETIWRHHCDESGRSKIQGYF